MSKPKEPKKRYGDGIPVAPTPQRISLDKAISFTQRHRKASPASEKGGFFYGVHVQALLSQPKCTGLRFYHGLDENCNYRLVLVGVDADGNDIDGSHKAGESPPATGKAAKAKTATKTKTAMMAMSGESDDAIILDSHWPCPPYCNGGRLA
jgi:hypothetical protein